MLKKIILLGLIIGLNNINVYSEETHTANIRLDS